MSIQSSTSCLASSHTISQSYIIWVPALEFLNQQADCGRLFLVGKDRESKVNGLFAVYVFAGMTRSQDLRPLTSLLRRSTVRRPPYL